MQNTFGIENSIVLSATSAYTGITFSLVYIDVYIVAVIIISNALRTTKL